jgi:tagatose 6-phosphate kinase
MSIGIVNLNVNVERIYAIPGFAAGKVYRPDNPVVQAGGKGINVARVLGVLGAGAGITGCCGGTWGRWIVRDLRQRRLHFRPFIMRGESRVCLAIYDTSRSLQTVINEPGRKLGKTEAARLRRHVVRFAADKEAVIFSGSVLPGITPAGYAGMVRDAAGTGAPVFVDIGGAHLRAALRQKPFLVKPNLEEWEKACGRQLATLQSVRASVKEFAPGVGWVVVSRGNKGFWAFHGGRCYEAVPPRINAVNAVGCGDALVAGLVKAVLAKRTPEETVRYAAAVAAAHALTPVPGDVRLKDINFLLNQIQVKAC